MLAGAGLGYAMLQVLEEWPRLLHCRRPAAKWAVGHLPSNASRACAPCAAAAYLTCLPSPTGLSTEFLPRSWHSVLHVNGVTVYGEEETEDGEGGAFMVSAVVRAPPDDTFTVSGQGCGLGQC